MRILLRDLSPGTNYKIQLRAVDDSGNSSEWSRLFDLTTTGDTIAPKTPTGVTNVVSGTAFKFTWDAVTQSEDNTPAHDLRNYRVLVTSTGSGSSRVYETTDTKMDFSFENNVAVFGTPQANVRVQVAAVDSVGNASAYSALVSATNPAPAAVTGLAGTVQIDAINLKWNANTTDNDLKGYEVHVSTTGSSGAYTKVYSGNATSYVHPTTLYTTDHFFRVYSVDIFGTLSTESQTTALRPNSPFAVDSNPPPVPTGLTATLTTQVNAGETLVSAAVSWNAVTDADNDLAGYRIGYRSVGSSDWSYVDVDYTNTSTKIDRLTAYVNYELRIRSYDWAANFSAWSSTFTTTTAGTNTAPAQVTGLLGVAGASSVTVLWTESADNDVKNGNGMYEVQMDTVNTFNSVNLKTIKTAATVASFLTDGLVPGNRYVRVRAVDSLGLVGTYSSTLTLNQTDVNATEAYSQSRGMNLFTNGTGLLGTNKNMTTFTFDAADRPFGGGSFKTGVTNVQQSNFSDELIPVDTAKTYIQTGYVRQCIPAQVGARFYLGIAAFDVDGLSIGAQNHMYLAGTTTTLAADLNPGATTVTLTSSANWMNGAGAGGYQRAFIFWNYTDSKGYTYPAETYSRNFYTDNTNGMWNAGGISGNVITLRVPWAGPAIPAGTSVSNNSSGGVYKYISASNVIAPQTWTKYQGRIGGVDYSGANVTNMFSPGTAFIKFLFLSHYPTLTSGQNSQIAYAGLNFTDVDGANLLPSTMGGDVVIANTLAGDRVIANSLDANTLKANTAFVQDLSVKSKFTLGDASTTGAIESFGYVAGTTGFRFDKTLLEINQGSIAAAALKIQSGANIMPPEYAGFEFVPAFYTGKLPSTHTGKTIMTSGARFGAQYLQYRTNTAAASEIYYSSSATDYNIPVEEGKTYILSSWLRPGAVTTNVFWQVKYNTGAASSTLGSLVLTGGNTAWVRHYTSWTCPAGVTSINIRTYTNTATSGAGWDIDGIQVEEKIGASDLPSVWKPPGVTSVDGGIIRTGEIRSTSTTTVNGVSQPAWSINMSGNAQLGDGLIRGKLLVGVSTPSANLAPGSGTFEVDTTGYTIHQEPSNSSTLTRTTTTPITGTGSALATGGTGVNTALGVYFTPSATIAGGTLVRVQAKVRSADANTGVAVKFWDGTKYTLIKQVTSGSTANSTDSIDVYLTVPALTTLTRIHIMGTAPTGGDINTVRIDDITVTTDLESAQSYISSGNFQSGVVGWKVDSSGAAEFNTGTFRGYVAIGKPRSISAPTVSVVAGTHLWQDTVGTKYYKISGFNTGGETVGSNEVTYTVASGGNGPILSWPTLPLGLNGVKIYRGTAAGAENVRLATIYGTNAGSYADYGNVSEGAGAPLSVSTIANSSQTVNIDESGFYAGATDFDSAPLSIDLAGNINAPQGTITGLAFQTARTGKKISFGASVADYYGLGNEMISFDSGVSGVLPGHIKSTVTASALNPGMYNSSMVVQGPHSGPYLQMDGPNYDSINPQSYIRLTGDSGEVGPISWTANAAGTPTISDSRGLIVNGPIYGAPIQSSVSLASGWSNYGAPYSSFRTFREPNGTLTFTGLVKRTGADVSVSTSGVVIGTILGGYTQATRDIMPCVTSMTGDNFCLQINENGQILLRLSSGAATNFTTNAWVSAAGTSIHSAAN